MFNKFSFLYKKIVSVYKSFKYKINM